MISKQVYLLLTAGLLLLSVGTGFAMQEHKSHKLAAIQSLQTASLQLNQISSQSPHQTKAAAMVDEAIRLLKRDMEE
jgi:hypothetical protein